MYSINQNVNYAAAGVCKIIDIKKEKLMNEIKEYYVLKPIYQDKSTIYIPVDNEVLTSRINPVINSEDLNELIDGIPEIETSWIDNDNERNSTFKGIIHSGDRKKIVKVIKSIYLRRKELDEKGKHLRNADMQIMNEAEKLIYNEFALVLGIEPEEVLPFLNQKLGNQE